MAAPAVRSLWSRMGSIPAEHVRESLFRIFLGGQTLSQSEYLTRYFLSAWTTESVALFLKPFLSLLPLVWCFPVSRLPSLTCWSKKL